MPGPGPRYPVNYEELADFFRALDSPVRLELLDQLRFPKTLTEIRLTPRRHARGENPERSSSKPVVLRHLDKLVETGFVTVRDVRRDGREVPEYAADPVRLYALMEDLRAIIVRHAVRAAGADATATAQGEGEPKAAVGPRVVLVRGAIEGKVFPLTDATAERGGWLIGREPGLAVSLDYDPFTSLEHARIAARRGGFSIEDLGSKNGTWVNWSLVAPRKPRPLQAGEVVGVGRSLLVLVES